MVRLSEYFLALLCFTQELIILFSMTPDFDTNFALNRILGGIVFTSFSIYNVLICA
jgi:hypothetical protein